MHSQSNYIDTAADEQEARYLVNRSRIRWLRTGLTLLVLAIALSITGCLGHSLHVFHQTNLGPGWWLPLWPQQIDTRPTNALLGASGAIAFLSLVVAGASHVPSPHPRITLLNTLAALTSLVGLALSIFGVAFNQTHSSSATRDTLQTWSCAFPDVSAPVDFGRICAETKAASNMMIVLLVLELLSTCVVAGSIWAEARMQKIRKALQEVKLSEQQPTAE